MQGTSPLSAAGAEGPGRVSRATAILITLLAYIPAVLSMMTIGVIVPLIEPLTRQLGATRAQLGMSIALISVPTAIFATVGGGLIDRYGVQRSMLFALAICALGSVAASQAGSLATFDAAMVLAGIGFGGLCVGSPCLIMSALVGADRTRAMSLWSTFAPVGYSAGLLLAVPYTGRSASEAALLTLAMLMAAAFLVVLAAFRRVASREAPTHDSARQSIGRILAVLREPGAVRLGIAVALPNGVSYGTSLAAPAYLARVHHLTIATSSVAVAVAPIAAMVIGAAVMGYLLSRAVSATVLFASMVATGLAAQAILFVPIGGMLLATAALVMWLFAFGGMAGTAMTLLPAVVSDPERGGAASGLVNQCISVASFAAPSAWLALRTGSEFLLVAAACLLVSLVALPRPDKRRAALVPGGA